MSRLLRLTPIRLLRAFRQELATERWVLLGGAAALAAEVAFKSLEPWPIKFVLDRVLGQDGVVGASPLASPTTAILLAALALVAIASCRAMATFLNTLAFSLAGTRVLSAVRLRLVEHLQRLSLAFHARARTGDLVQRLGRDVDLLRDVLVTALLPLAGNLLTLVVLGGVMVWLNWRLALVALGVLPLFAALALRQLPRINRAARKQRRREGETFAALSESLGAIREIKALGLERRLAGQMRRREVANAKDEVRGRRLAAALERSVDVLTALASALVLAIGASLALSGRATVGELVVFLSYLKSAFKPVQDVAKYMNRLAKATASGERLLDLLDAVPAVTDRDDAIDAPALRGRIELERVRFGYRPDRPVIQDASLAVAPGEMVALIGPSGHGKSTIGALLLRLYDPTHGTITFDGTDLRAYRVASVRRQISVVPQEAVLFATTIADNIGQGDPSVDRAAIVAAARLAHAHEFIEALPGGYEAPIGERGLTLSAGQRQRIALARAAVRDTPILLLDEPTTGLDEHNRRAVGDAIVALARGRTTIVITHDFDLAARADRIVLLEQGRLREERHHAVA